MSRCPECGSKGECDEFCGYSFADLVDEIRVGREKIEELESKLEIATDALEAFGEDRLAEIKEFQDSFLRDREAAYKWFKLRSCDDSDEALLTRQIAYREGYAAGTYEIIKQIKGE